MGGLGWKEQVNAMIGKILGALTVVRHAVAITLVTGAAGAMVAGSLDSSGYHQAAVAASTTTATVASANQTTGDLETSVKACLATKDPQSLECAKAVDKSGFSREDFWANTAMSLSERVKQQSKTDTKTEPTKTDTRTEPEPAETTKPNLPTRELLALVSTCVQSHERSSEACQKALEASGLPDSEFWLRVGAMFAKANDTPKPETTKPNDQTLSLLVRDCLEKYAAAKSTGGGSPAASDACRKAIEASGLSSSDFWARFGPRTSSPEPTKRPEPTKKPETRTEPPVAVSTAQLEVLVKDCFAKYLAAKTSGDSSGAGAAAGDACRKAIAASGLAPAAFWTRYGTPDRPANTN